MKHDRLNPATYELRDVITGEVLDIAVFIQDATKNGWEKAYTDTLAQYIGITGDSPSKVLAYFISEKDGMNRIVNTVRGIAEDTETSIATVSKIVKLLQKNDLIKMARNGVYMLTPKMIRYGSTTSGAMLLRIWDDLSGRDDQKKVHKELLEAGI